MGITALLVSTAISVGGSIYQGMAARSEAKSEAAMQKYKANLEIQKAKEIEVSNRYKQMRMAEQFARRQSSLEHKLATSGGVATEGAPLMIAANQAFESERDLLMEGREGAISASQARSRAGFYTMGAKAAKTRGKSAMTAAYFGAGKSLIKGFDTYQSEYS